MDWQQRMARAIGWIEDHLTEGFSVDSAAREANCSAFHFMRMFAVITGITPAEYVRRRRLSRAAVDIASTDARVIDVALHYGYDSPDSFARAFRREFGVNPSDAREPGTTLHAYPPISFTIAIQGDKAMEYKIEKRPAYRLAGFSIRQTTADGSNFVNIPKFWDEAMADGRCDRLWQIAANSPLGVVGVCYDHDMKTGDFSYAIAIEAPADRSILPEGMADIEVPESTWAMFVSRGPMVPNYQNMIKRIYSEWFPSSGREHAGTAEIEFYNTHPDPTAADYWCEYWVPLK